MVVYFHQEITHKCACILLLIFVEIKKKYFHAILGEISRKHPMDSFDVHGAFVSLLGTGIIFLFSQKYFMAGEIENYLMLNLESFLNLLYLMS